MKVCKKCGFPKDEATEFHIIKRTGKPRCWCKVCVNRDNIERASRNKEKSNARCYAWRAANPGRTNANIKAWQKNNPERHRANMRRHKYGIEFDALCEAQGGLCAACGGPLVLGGRELKSVCVDHDRTCCPGMKSCGKCVRGLIHWGCNMALGHAEDNPKLLADAIAYLERWQSKKTTSGQ